MKPMILSYDCAEHDPIDLWVPEKYDEIDFWLTLNIGSDLISGEDFKVRIVTTNQIRHGDAQYAWVIQHYHFATILQALTSVVENCTGNDWQDVTQKLSQYFWWEYADYR